MNKRLYQGVFGVVVLVVLFATSAVSVFAAGATPEKPSLFSQFIFGFNKTANAIYPEGHPQPLNLQILSYVNFLLTFTGLIFFFLMLYSGWLWFMARGNESDVERAQEIIREVTIGFLMIVLARIFTEFVVAQVFLAINGS